MVIAFVALAIALSDSINPLLLFIRLFSSSNNACATLLLDNIVLFHAVCDVTPSSLIKQLYSLIFNKSFVVIVGEKLLNKPLIPLLMFPFVFLITIAFFRSAKLLLKILILFIVPFNSVVIVLNILL